MIPLIQMAGSSPAMTARTNVITGLGSDAGIVSFEGTIQAMKSWPVKS